MSPPSLSTARLKPAGGLADLHRHLDGSMRPATLLELSAAAGRPLAEVPRFFAGMGLQAALDCFAITIAALQTASAIERVAAEIAEDAAREGVTTLELRFAPQLHGGAAKGEPSGPRAIGWAVDAALAGLQGRGGLLLCALYGEAPEAVAALVAVAAARPGVVGVDLAGGPAPHHRYGMADYASAFQAARRAGLGVTVHAGEGRPPAEIAFAIEHLGASRVGHGTTLLRDEAVLALVVRRQVTIEACITSNVHVGAIAAATDHDLPRWLDLGVRACICSDNTLLSAVDCRSEVELAGQLPGMDAEKLARAIAFGHGGRFGGGRGG